MIIQFQKRKKKSPISFPSAVYYEKKCTMFYGKNLQIIRMLHDLSRKELGEKLRVSEQFIWQFEKQMIEPSFENILQMKEILKVKSSFFV